MDSLWMPWKIWGSGVFIKYPDGSTTSISKPTGQICANFKAVVIAINLAANHLIQAPQRWNNIVILTDSLSTALALESSNTDDSIKNLKDTLVQLTGHNQVVIQWIPAHCGIPGNDKADLLARDGSQQHQQITGTSYNDEKNSGDPQTSYKKPHALSEVLV